MCKSKKDIGVWAMDYFVLKNKRSYLWAYYITNNVGYLKKLREMDRHYVDTMAYIWDIDYAGWN